MMRVFAQDDSRPGVGRDDHAAPAGALHPLAGRHDRPHGQHRPQHRPHLQGREATAGTALAPLPRAATSGATAGCQGTAPGGTLRVRVQRWVMVHQVDAPEQLRRRPVSIRRSRSARHHARDRERKHRSVPQHLLNGSGQVLVLAGVALGVGVTAAAAVELLDQPVPHGRIVRQQLDAYASSAAVVSCPARITDMR